MNNNVIELNKISINDKHFNFIRDYTTPQYFGAKGDGKTDDTVALQAAIDKAIETGSRLFIPKGTYVFSDRLFIKGSLVVYGEGPDKTILHFVGGRNKVETKPYDTVWYDESDAAIIIASYDVSLEDFQLLGMVNKVQSTFNGIIMHYLRKNHVEGTNAYEGAQRCKLERITIDGFRNNVFLYAGWTRFILNCNFNNASDSGIKYLGLEPSVVGKWSCSGDIIMSCTFNGCKKAGVFASGCYQEALYNCVCEYCGRAFDIEYCQEITLYNCWNEANYDIIKVIGSATFIGGYNIIQDTVDSSQGFVTLQNNIEKIVLHGNTVSFRQVGGVISQGVDIGVQLDNVLKNISFYENSLGLKIPSMINWDVYCPRDGGKISTDILFNGENTFHFTYDNLDNNPEFCIIQEIKPTLQEYKVGCYIMSEDRSTLDNGFSISVFYYNAENEVINFDKYVQYLVGNNVWEQMSTIVKIPKNTAYFKVKFGPRNNGDIYMAAPFVSNTTNEESSNLLLKYSADTNEVYIKDINGDTKVTIDTYGNISRPTNYLAENLLLNSSFNDNGVPSTTGWYAYPRGEISTSIVHDNDYSYHLSFSGWPADNEGYFHIGTENKIAITQQYYKIGFFYTSLDPSTIDKGCYCTVRWYQDDVCILNQSFDFNITQASQWEEFSTILTVQTNATHFTIQMGTKLNGDIYIASPYVYINAVEKKLFLQTFYDTEQNLILFEDAKGTIIKTLPI